MATLNITWGGENGDLPDEVDYDATDDQIVAWATEAVRGGDIQGIAADPNADFDNFVVQRFAAKDDKPERIMLRPKVPFGGSFEGSYMPMPTQGVPEVWSEDEFEWLEDEDDLLGDWPKDW